jgi:hypothetical protein
MYVSFDDGARWQPLQLDHPVTPVTGIEVKGRDLVVSTMGRGFWILRDVGPLRQLAPDVAAAPAHLFTPGPAVLLRYRPSAGDGAVEPEYPEPGAVVDWTLAAEPTGPVTVELLSAEGAAVNGWTSESGAYALRTQQGMRAEETVRIGGPRVPRAAGHTRFILPLEHPGQWRPASGSRPAGAGPGGPAVAPGEYRVRVSAAGWSATAPLLVTMDPRVREAGATAADLQAQEELALRVRDLASRAARLSARVDEAMRAAEATVRRIGEEGAESGLEAGARLRTLREIRALLETDDGVTYAQPMLSAQIQYLYGMVARGQHRPGGDAYARLAELAAELERLEARVP